MSNEVPPGVMFVGCLVIIAAVIFAPLLTIWCINTLFVGPLHGDLIPYDIFSKYWWAALLSGGVAAALFGARKSNQ